MKPFALEAVLKYRHRLKDLARIKFLEARRQYHELKKQLDDTTIEQAHLIETLSLMQKHGIEIEEYIRYENRIDLLKAEIGRLRERVKRKQQIVARERNHLLEKSKKHRVMEKLKEQQDRKWHQFLDKKETAMLDEVAALYKKR